jgi:Cd2+/Zn2+-exporting ATPase/Cu+-exporting ATPase
VQRLADRFTAWYIPVVVGAAALTYLLGRDLTAAIAVLLVSCACAIALATPTAVIAAVGGAARRGILIKGGQYLELLAGVDTVVMDKTGTLTFGRPAVTDVVALDGRTEDEVLRLAATAERMSGHPVAAAVRQAARDRGLTSSAPDEFQALVGLGVRALSGGARLLVGNRQLLEREGVAVPAGGEAQAAAWQGAGRTAFFVAVDGSVIGLMAVADSPRPEVPEALAAMKQMGIERFLLLTGDNERTTRALADQVGIEYRAGLLPEDKIAVVKALQEEGHTVLMVGDGVNDAPALAQADVGVAMGVVGTDAALEAADIALMQDDWRALPEAVRVGRRSFQVIQQNLGLGVLYNVVGITLAATGILTPVAAAAGQSIPDLLIMLSSARLLRS